MDLYCQILVLSRSNAFFFNTLGLDLMLFKKSIPATVTNLSNSFHSILMIEIKYNSQSQSSSETDSLGRKRPQRDETDDGSPKLVMAPGVFEESKHDLLHR